ncbi:glycogenin glucosyltransferase [Mycoemilia scoparia]|uniref:Glycogenin glucosyltransferase n=1 Tax=Mycoemilia scoparia TaxID=417184 RepID=A0A9W8DQH5_9FUNG|nr:glycogenin glucosyltransferase [Mycoemilia scoparia]
MCADRRYAYITLVTSDDYIQGALVLFHSIRHLSGSRLPVVCLATPSFLSPESLSLLESTFDSVIHAEPTVSTNNAGLTLLGRPDLAYTLTKIELWRPSLAQDWDALLYLDADTLINNNVDDVFERVDRWKSDSDAAHASSHTMSKWECGDLIAAAPDIGWPDCFNSGVMLIRPGVVCYNDLISRANTPNTNGSFDGADQGLLNSCFSDWSQSPSYRRLPFLYNVTKTAFYSYTPALSHYGHDTKIVHFIGQNKPWRIRRGHNGQVVSGPGASSMWNLPKKPDQVLEISIQDEPQKIHPHTTSQIKPVCTGSDKGRALERKVEDEHRPAMPDYPGAPEVSDWHKDWSWADNRVHPFDFNWVERHATPQSEPQIGQQGYKGKQISEHSVTYDANNRHDNAPGGSLPPQEGPKSRFVDQGQEQSYDQHSIIHDENREWAHQHHTYAYEHTQSHSEPNHESYDARQHGHSRFGGDYGSEKYAQVPTHMPIYEASQVVIHSIPRHAHHTTNAGAETKYEEGQTVHHRHHNQHHHEDKSHSKNPTFSDVVETIENREPKASVVNPAALWESEEQQRERREKIKEYEKMAHSSVYASQTIPVAPDVVQTRVEETQHPTDNSYLTRSFNQGIAPTVETRSSGKYGSEKVAESPLMGNVGLSIDRKGQDQNVSGTANYYQMPQVRDEDVRKVVTDFLQQWHKIIAARTINDNGYILSSNPMVESDVLRIDSSSNRVLLNTVVSCQTRDDQGRMTEHKFTLNSSMRVSPDGVPENHTFNVYPGTEASGVNNDTVLGDSEIDHGAVLDNVNEDGEYGDEEEDVEKMRRHLPVASTPYPRSPVNYSESDDSYDDGSSIEYVEEDDVPDDNYDNLDEDANGQSYTLPRRSSVIAFNGAGIPTSTLPTTGLPESHKAFWDLQRQLVSFQMSQNKPKVRESQSTNDDSSSDFYTFNDRVIDKIRPSSPPTPDFDDAEPIMYKQRSPDTNAYNINNTSGEYKKEPKVETSSMDDFANYRITWNMNEIKAIPKQVAQGVPLPSNIPGGNMWSSGEDTINQGFVASIAGPQALTHSFTPNPNAELAMHSEAQTSLPNLADTSVTSADARSSEAIPTSSATPNIINPSQAGSIVNVSEGAATPRSISLSSHNSSSSKSLLLSKASTPNPGTWIDSHWTDIVSQMPELVKDVDKSGRPVARRQRSMTEVAKRKSPDSTNSVTKEKSGSGTTPRLRRGKSFTQAPNTRRYVGNIEVTLLGENEEEHDEPDKEIQQWFWYRAMRKSDEDLQDKLESSESPSHPSLRHSLSTPHFMRRTASSLSINGNIGDILPPNSYNLARRRQSVPAVGILNSSKIGQDESESYDPFSKDVEKDSKGSEEVKKDWELQNTEETSAIKDLNGKAKASSDPNKKKEEEEGIKSISELTNENENMEHKKDKFVYSPDPYSDDEYDDYLDLTISMKHSQ